MCDYKYLLCDYSIKLTHRSYVSMVSFLLHCFIIVGGFTELRSTYAWVDFAKAGDESPPVLCRLEIGKHSVYTKIQYQIQARYHTWMADWSMQRPTGYARDEAEAGRAGQAHGGHDGSDGEHGAAAAGLPG